MSRTREETPTRIPTRGPQEAGSVPATIPSPPADPSSPSRNAHEAAPVAETERARYRKRRKQLAPLRRVVRQLWAGMRVTFAVAVAWALLLLVSAAGFLFLLFRWLLS